MSSGIEELVIPVRMDTGKAAQDLKKLGVAGKGAGDDTAQGFGKAASGAQHLGSEIAGVMKAQLGLSAIKQAANAMGSEFKRSADYVHGLAAKFEDVRKAMQQVAALRGEDNSNEFTLKQVEQGAKAGLMPEEWTRAQEEFQSRAGAYVGAGAGDQARLTDQEGEEYQRKIAAFAKARGIDPSEAMSLGGGLLQFSEGKQDVGNLMDRYGKVFKTLERAPTPVKQLLPQMSRVQAQGFSPEEAAQALAIMSEAMPGEEETGVENAMKAITDAKLDGKGEQLGLRKGMTPMQELEAASKTLKQRVDNGEDVDVLMKEYAPDLRQRRAMLGFMNRGVGAQGFERVRGYSAETAPDFTEQATKDYEKSDEGKAARRRVNQALAEARRGHEHQAETAALEEAQAKVTESGALEEGRASNLARGTLGGVTGVDAEHQIVNEQALKDLRNRAIGLGITGNAEGGVGYNVDSKTGQADVSDVKYRTQAQVNEEIKLLVKLLEKIAANTDTEKAIALGGAGLGAALTMPTPANNGGVRQ